MKIIFNAWSRFTTMKKRNLQKQNILEKILGHNEARRTFDYLSAKNNYNKHNRAMIQRA